MAPRHRGGICSGGVSCPHPNPSCLLSRFLRAAWGGVCLCASSKAIMRGPRPHGKLEPDFWSRVPSLIRSYRLRECNGLLHLPLCALHFYPDIRTLRSVGAGGG